MADSNFYLGRIAAAVSGIESAGPMSPAGVVALYDAGGGQQSPTNMAFFSPYGFTSLVHFQLVEGGSRSTDIQIAGLGGCFLVVSTLVLGVAPSLYAVAQSSVGQNYAFRMVSEGAAMYAVAVQSGDFSVRLHTNLPAAGRVNFWKFDLLYGGLNAE